MSAVESHVTDDILYITFSRPAHLNALTVADLGQITALVTHQADHVRPWFSPAPEPARSPQGCTSNVR